MANTGNRITSEDTVRPGIFDPLLRLSKSAKNERGIALVLALVMLVLLSILGTWALDTTSTDLKIAGNYRNNDIAFYTAEAGLGYAVSQQILTSGPVYGLIPTPDPQALPAVPPQWTIPSTNVPAGAQPAFTGSITYTGCGALPGSSLNSGDIDPNGACGGYKTYGLYFSVISTGKAMNNTSVTVEKYVALIAQN